MDVKWIDGVLRMIYPQVCEVCGRSLCRGEDVMCLHCLRQLPRVSSNGDDFNLLHERLASTVEMAVQVQGKLRGTINVPADSEEAAVVEAAKAVDKVARAIEGMEIVKVIHVKNKLVNLIVKPAK